MKSAEPILLLAPPSPADPNQVPKTSLNEESSLALILCLAIISIVYTFGLMVLVFARKEMQPLKIKSPHLLLLSIFANLFIIMSVSVIQLAEEKCVND